LGIVHHEKKERGRIDPRLEQYLEIVDENIDSLAQGRKEEFCVQIDLECACELSG